MNYLESITDFFKSPKWVMNLLLPGVCLLIPIVGPIVVMGWLITGFWGTQDDAAERFPDFDFNHFVKYLERGLWPFLVTLVATLVTIPVFGILVSIPTFLMAALMGDGSGAGGVLGALFGLMMMVVYVVMITVLLLVLKPLVLRATLTQDFVKAFDFTFVKRFISLTWMESLVSSLFLLVASLVLMPLGMLVLCIGVYFAMVLTYYSWMHLDKQIYRLYLSRGGEPVPLSPKLSDLPPTLPA